MSDHSNDGASTSNQSTNDDSIGNQQLPVINLGAGGSAYGDYVAEIDSSAPIMADRIFGDLIPPPSNMNRSRSKSSARSGKQSRTGESIQENVYEQGGIDDSEDDEETTNPKTIDDDHLDWAKGLPWYKRPSEKWLRPVVLLLAMGSGMIMGPKIDLGMQLICEEVLGVESVMPTPHERPPLSMQCRQSDDVAAGYSSLALRITLAMGIVSAITTGFWGTLSDRRGRTIPLRLTTFGILVSDVAYIALGLFPQSAVPFGKNLLVIASLIEGLCGGIPTLSAAFMAYIADVTPSGTRATLFSFFTGLFFCGIAIGPALGGLVAKHTHSTVTTFYIALAAHLICFICAAFLLPESNSPDRMRKAQDEYDEYAISTAARRAQPRTDRTRIYAAYRRLRSNALTPLKPLKLLLPHRRHDQVDIDETEAMASHISVSRSQKNSLDWNLTFVAIAYFLEASAIGIMTPKINYAIKKFEWDVLEIGYFLSYASFTRVACLTIIIPFLVRVVHNPVKRSALPQDGRSGIIEEEHQADSSHLDEDGRPTADEYENAPLLQKKKKSTAAPKRSGYGATDNTNTSSDSDEDSEDDHPTRVEKLWAMRARHLRQIHDSKFDRRLVIGSLMIAASCYFLLAILSNAGPIPFVALSGLISLGGAASAALSSLALALLESDRDAGKFFAAWSVLSALSQTIIGPIVFTEVFVKTVSFAPQSIFVLGCGLFIFSGLAVFLIRVRSTRSLPGLPPRPHTPASLRALRKKKSGILDDGQGTGPFKSSSSRIRLRQSNPFQSAQSGGD
ncbi:MFS general substrate transporter [Meira miltonrushii]|uniref:MFS general substrate transporter n=1 Tax=Meira miltonrushii TaxID=1280837 RepID=A0A316V517_9BASI|nr:MFS general substrate transporter [Meira miltonrushii]PWN32552.1 MFS general substrate transporter [Meira miltonrushii]